MYLYGFYQCFTFNVNLKYRFFEMFESTGFFIEILALVINLFYKKIFIQFYVNIFKESRNVILKVLFVETIYNITFFSKKKTSILV